MKQPNGHLTALGKRILRQIHCLEFNIFIDISFLNLILHQQHGLSCIHALEEVTLSYYIYDEIY